MSKLTPCAEPTGPTSMPRTGSVLDPAAVVLGFREWSDFDGRAFLWQVYGKATDLAGVRERQPAQPGAEISDGVTKWERAMHPMDEEMRRCVDACLTCHRVCLTTLSQHCLDVGGRHVEPRHTRLMLACAEICRTSAFFMELGTEFHKRTCAVCAEVCSECASSCESLDGMQECAQTCRHCADSCRRMAA